MNVFLVHVSGSSEELQRINLEDKIRTLELFQFSSRELLQRFL